jgi:iron complex transport system ATP-binding protein
VLSIEHLSAGYGARAVLHDFNLEVGRGQIAAVIGPNGCGKSTFLRCAAGLLTPRQGRVAVGGDQVQSLAPRERARRIALLPQTFEGGEHLSTQEMVMLGRTPHLAAYGAPSRRDEEIVHDALASVGAEALRGRVIGELSGGERQRVVLARALAQQPQVLLLDEPTSHLDIRYQFEILDLVRKLARREKLAVVLVLHQINLASDVSDVVVLLAQDGRTRAAGSPAEVMTAGNLTEVYGVPLEIVLHPRSGRPQARADWVFSE